MLKFMSRVLLVVTVTFIFFSLYASLSKVYPFNWSVILKYRRLFYDGLLTTLRLSVTALGLSLLVGFIIALFRTSRILVLKSLV